MSTWTFGVIVAGTITGRAVSAIVVAMWRRHQRRRAATRAGREP